MRLIDADALINKLEDWRGDKEDVDMNDAHDVGYFAAMSRAIMFTRLAPTVNAKTLNDLVSNVPEKNVGEFGGVINAVD